MRILIVDENAVDRRRIVEVLERFLPGARFVQPGSPAEVDAALLWGGFDLVITEYHLSWTDGLALLRMVKALMPRVPVVFVTAVDSAEVAVQAMKAGLSDYVLKSCLASRLPGVVQETLGRPAPPVPLPVPSDLSPIVVTLSDDAEAEADRLWTELRAQVKEFTAGLSDVSGPKPELSSLVRNLYVEPGQPGLG